MFNIHLQLYWLIYRSRSWFWYQFVVICLVGGVARVTDGGTSVKIISGDRSRRREVHSPSIGDQLGGGWGKWWDMTLHTTLLYLGLNMGVMDKFLVILLNYMKQYFVHAHVNQWILEWEEKLIQCSNFCS